MARKLLFVTIGLIALAVAGFVSDLVSRSAVESSMTMLNREAIARIDRSWRIAPRPINEVRRGAVAYRTDVVDAKPVRHQFPPPTPVPFEYAHASPFAPFVLKVRYGWAGGGTRMKFGEGGEYFVASFFGTRPIVLRKQPHWFL